MATINLYKQARIDGGVRIGAEVDDQEMLHEPHRSGPGELLG